jgi:hypothetical protein
MVTDKQKEQPELELFAAPASPVNPAAARRVRKIGHAELRQLALGFLAAARPDGLAASVPVRFQKYKVAAAAFWTRETGRRREVAKTALVEIYDRRDRCFPECADRQALLAAIHELRERRQRLQDEIRATEPQLADSDDLFSEFRTWRYEESRNPEYVKLQRRLEKLRRALHQGSRLEHIRNAGVADELYLAVPEGAIEADEVASGWGLLHVGPDGGIREISRPERRDCDPALRNHLALNIAAAAAHSVLFASGVAVRADGNVRFYRPPRRRMKRVLVNGTEES